MTVLAEYSSSYSVYLSYDVGSIYFDLAQAHKHFQTIVQLAYTCPTMSYIHLVIFLTLYILKQTASGSRNTCTKY